MHEATHDDQEKRLASLRRLSDDELVARLKSLAARERRATVLLVAHLAEFDTRDVYLRAAYPSLFSYCRNVLALSEHEALNRIEVARAARRYPVILERLAAGEMNLTSVRLLGPHLTPENHLEVLDSARGRKIEEMVARLSPRADVRPSLRKVPDRTPRRREATPELPTGWTSDEAGSAGCRANTNGSLSERTPGSAWASRAGAASRQASGPDRSGGIRPLAPERYKYVLTIGSSTLEKLRLAKDMLRHAVPSGDDETILDRALTALLTELARKKFGTARATSSPEKGAGSARPRVGESGGARRADSRSVPAEVKRAVWVRDLGRCGFTAADGRRCNERAFVEFHHVRPYAVGGRPTLENIQLRCRRHNGYEARVFFAREDVDDVQATGAGSAKPVRLRTKLPGQSSGHAPAAGAAICRGAGARSRGRSGTTWLGEVASSHAAGVATGSVVSS
jgi:hypothetical protein